MKAFILIISLLFSGALHAGMFLDLDIGSHVGNYPDNSMEGTAWLGNENPLGLFRFGYKTDSYNMFGEVDISAHGYFQHISSMRTGSDTGIDVIMVGVRFE